MTQYSSTARDDYKRCVCDSWGSSADCAKGEDDTSNVHYADSDDESSEEEIEEEVIEPEVPVDDVVSEDEEPEIEEEEIEPEVPVEDEVPEEDDVVVPDKDDIVPDVWKTWATL